MRTETLRGTQATVGFVVCMLSASMVLSGDVPTIIFAESGIYLRANPEEHAKLGEKLSLTDLGRRFPSCRVTAEYYQGDEEGIATTITCGDVAVTANIDEDGKIQGFSTDTKGAAYSDNVQVGDSVVPAIGSVAYCNLCTEDEMPYCKPDKKSIIRYDVSYSDENCKPVNIEDSESCRGIHQIKTCVAVAGLGHG